MSEAPAISDFRARQRALVRELLAADFLKRKPTDPRMLQIFGSALLLQVIAPLAQAARRTDDPAIEMQAAMAMSKADRPTHSRFDENGKIDLRR
jgi:hypothetical protein